ncbi:MAG: hypothetical protein NT080_03375 [Spirochaetes bacterium]|nr:hypothetical protein [Spirochaetota bacterium]
MGILRFFQRLFTARKATEPARDLPWLLGELSGRNFSFLAGKTAAVGCERVTFETWDGAFAAEKRIVIVNAFRGTTWPGARLLIGDAAVVGLSQAYQAARVGAMPPGTGADLAAIGFFTENFERLIDLPGGTDGIAPAIRSCEIASSGSLPALRWSLCDSVFFKLTTGSRDAYIAIDETAEAAIRKELGDPDRATAYVDAVLERSPEGDAVPGEFIDAVLRIADPKEYPLATVLVPARVEFSGRQARLSPTRLLLCSTSGPIAALAGFGFRLTLRIGEAETRLWLFESEIGDLAPPSTGWSALLGGIAKHCVASLQSLLGVPVAVKETSGCEASDALQGGYAAAFAYAAAAGAGRGTVVAAFEAGLLAVLARRVFKPDDLERLALTTRNLFLAVQSINAVFYVQVFARRMQRLSSTPKFAAWMAETLPAAGLPLYLVLEELRERDVGIMLAKLAQKGFLAVQDLLAFFSYTVSELDGDSGEQRTHFATPVADPESLFGKFPRRWRKEALPPGRSPRVFRRFEDLLEAHYAAVWLLYGELLVDRLSLSKIGESVLRMTGQAFADSVRRRFDAQTAIVASMFGEMTIPAKRRINWAAGATGIIGNPGIADSLVPFIGKQAAETLRSEMERQDACLRDGREDLVEAWKARKVFIRSLEDAD